MGEKGDTQAGKLYAHPVTRLALLSLSALAVSAYVLVKSPVVVAGHTEPTTPLAYQHALVVQSGLPSLGLLLVMLYILLLKNTKDALNAASGPWRRLRLGSNSCSTSPPGTGGPMGALPVVSSRSRLARALPKRAELGARLAPRARSRSQRRPP